MDPSQAKHLEPMIGETFYWPRWPLLGPFLISLLAFGGGLLLIWMIWGTELFGNASANPIQAGLATVFVVTPFLLGGIIGTAFCLRCMFPRRCVIIADDRLQCLVGRRRVVVQIPFRNIAKMELVQKGAKDNWIGVDLADLQDADTWCPRAESMKKLKGWHLTFGSASSTTEQVYQRLRERAKSIRVG